MKNESERELQRQLEEPLNRECRNYPQSRDSALITMLDTPYYPPYMRDSLHYHNCLEIGFCAAGYGRVFLHESVHPYSSGSMIVAPRGVRHSQENMGEPLTHWLYLVIDEELLLSRLPSGYAAPIGLWLESIRTTGVFLESLSAESGVPNLVKLMFDLFRHDGSASLPELELSAALILMLLARLDADPLGGTGQSAALPHLRQPVEPALSFIYEHYKEDIRIEDLARSCSMSESYFRKTFVKIMGQPPLEYVNRYRIHRSLNLLRTTSDSILNIAMRTGFSSIAAFNRNFKLYVGLSPSQWRSRHQSRP